MSLIMGNHSTKTHSLAALFGLLLVPPVTANDDVRLPILELKCSFVDSSNNFTNANGFDLGFDDCNLHRSRENDSGDFLIDVQVSLSFKRNVAFEKKCHKASLASLFFVRVKSPETAFQGKYVALQDLKLKPILNDKEKGLELSNVVSYDGLPVIPNTNEKPLVLKQPKRLDEEKPNFDNYYQARTTLLSFDYDSDFAKSIFEKLPLENKTPNIADLTIELELNAFEPKGVCTDVIKLYKKENERDEKKRIKILPFSDLIFTRKQEHVFK